MKSVSSSFADVVFSLFARRRAPRLGRPASRRHILSAFPREVNLIALGIVPESRVFPILRRRRSR